MYLQQFILSLTCFELYLQFNHSNENVQLIFVQLNLFKTCAGILYLNKSDLPRHIFGRNASLLVWYSHHLDMHQPYLSISLSFLSNFFCKENSSVMAYRYRGANVFEKWQKALSLTCFELHLRFNNSNENIGILYLNKSDLPWHIFDAEPSKLHLSLIFIKMICHRYQKTFSS